MTSIIEVKFDHVWERGVDRRVAELAARQYGVISRRQLVGLGLSRQAIDRRVSARRLHPIHRGIYAVGHPVLRAHGRWMAAVLAYSPHAVVSHRDAAAIWDIRASARAKIDVTVPGRSRRPQPSIDLHLVRHLDPREVTTHERIPVTTAARTLFDLAEVLPSQALEWAFNQAQVLELFDLAALTEVIDRNPGRHALSPLRALLPTLTDDPELTRSDLERRFLELVRAAGLPLPLTNVHVAGYEVDALWPKHGFVVELDGFAYHRSRAAFERDHLKTEALELAGFRVRRFTYRRVNDDPGGVIEVLRKALSA